MNAVAERYVHLVLALGQHDPDYVDAFYGPAEWKTEAEKERAGNLLAQAAVPFTLLESVDLSLPISATDIEQKREAFTQLFQLAVNKCK